MTPKISIVVPVYNSAKYLRECIDSVRNQSFDEWELVAVDDGSSDDSPRILDTYAAEDPRIRIIHKANGGVSAARNDGLAAAVGEYVLFVDSDDWLDSRALKVSYDEAVKCNADVVITDHWNWKENGSEVEHHFFAKDFVAETKADIQKLQRTVFYRGYAPYPSESCSYMFSALWTKLIRRRLLVENNIQFNGRLKLYEDGLVALQVFQFSNKVSYKRNATYHYRILNNSLCHINERRLVTDCANILDELQSFLKVHNSDGALDEAFYARTLFLTKKMALRSFFCKGAEGSFLNRYKAFKNVLLAEPYCSAIKRTGKMKLCGNEKSYGKLMGCRLFLLTALMYELRSRLRHH